MTENEPTEAPSTPTTEQVRDMYEFGVREADRHHVPIDVPEAMAMFDRWLAGRDARIRAEVLEEAAQSADGFGIIGVKAADDTYWGGHNDAAVKIRDAIRAKVKGA